ncbi:glutamate--tRNA ligase [Hyphococcus luteus]|uniref:Glutamate--tRNA ligase n=1 Tax=Hyphococcus luteus TaxID=2058213 RepID=A0A2S7K482_9PROT|nr:glutamate--tRNA ligase [Marinicaulis flavus]PQA87291.1 glutamate--tRNA ligase [Marinicaulis flavus]
MTVKVRFAPSPTGKIHVGNVRAALWNWLFARKSGGIFVLRIDDTDLERSTKAFEDGIRADLAWLGLDYDETFSQSARFDRYDAAVEKLKAAELLYPCYESAEELDRKRKIQRARGLPPVYDRAALALTDDQIAAYEAEGRKPHWRFKLSQGVVKWDDLIRGETTVDTASVSDPVLIREDGMYLYTLPSCVDDIDSKITHVMRGEDHVTNTGVQIELMKALGGEPPQFAHHSLLVGADGEGLSKRLGSLSIEAMREDGLEPAAITSLLAKLGTADPVLPQPDLQALAESFDFDRVGRAPARFDMAELEALNAKILHETPYDKVADRLEKIGVSEALWEAVKGNITRLKDAAAWIEVVDGAVDPVIEDQDFAKAAAALVPDQLDTDSWTAFTNAVKEKTGAKGKALFMPLRLALTGRQRGPEMAALFPLIGSEKARARLNGERA